MRKHFDNACRKLFGFIGICFVLLLVLSLFGVFNSRFGQFFAPANLLDELTGTVTKVVDGDTFVLEDGETIRMIGVDTPELHHPEKSVEYFAKEAFEFTQTLIQGQKVMLRFDEERTDKYGRTLAYVYLQDGTFVNAELVRRGVSPAYTKYPFSMKEDFVALEAEATNLMVGIWAKGGAGELEWLKSGEDLFFKLYPMSQGRWGVEYNSFSRSWISSSELIQLLETLRVQIYALSPRDLESELLRTGWVKHNG